jgi:excisionase family DNA binding protein
MTQAMTEKAPRLPEPRTMEIPELAKMLGIPRSTAYELARRDQLPVPVLRLGRRRKVSRAAVEELLAARKASS